MFSATQNFQNFIRLNCGNPWTPRLEGAVNALGAIVKQMG
jgi:DNA-binding transcriptional MocR family regulator